MINDERTHEIEDECENHARCTCGICHEHVLIGMDRYNRRRCHVKGHHTVHEASLPEGGIAQWHGPVGHTVIEVQGA